jgi:hexosaminidase
MGFTKICGSVHITAYPDASLAKDNLTTALRTVLGENLLTNDENGTLINFRLDTNIPFEGYKICIDNGKIDLFANSKNGFLYSVVTLNQLFSISGASNEPELILENIEIEDEPRHTWRGFMLDEARHFFGIDEVKRLLDIMLELKLNKFHWHLSNDQGFRIESRIFPRLNEIASTRSDTQIGGWRSKSFRGTGHEGYYKQEEIAEVVTYAASRGIEIIPELSTPGHMAAIIAAYNELSCSGGSATVPNTFGRHNIIACAGKEATFQFLTALIDEWAALFPSPHFHLGGNHARTDNWKNCPYCHEVMQEQNLSNTRELETYILNRLANHVLSLDKTPLLRSDSLSEKSSAGILGDYYLRLNNDNFMKFLATGGKYISARHKAYYLDHPYALTPLKLTYNYTPELDDTQINTSNHLVGVVASLFTEWVYDREKIDFNTFPRLAAVAETGWSQPGHRNFKNFLARLKYFNRTLKQKNYAFAKPRIALKRNPIKRLRGLLRWLFSDQYSEVRENRGE